jgi:methylenetetrahydrofolate dehydrogenase (NADP+) / methenyltetrahydrofolate cyclohydrolase
MTRILAGAPVAERMKAEVTERIASLMARGITPGLAVVIVGSNPASQTYVANKVRTSRELGLHSEKYELPEATTTEELLALVEKLNRNNQIDGILVQLPLPGQIDALRVLEAVDPAKDVDGLHPFNLGRLVQGQPSLVACTPSGIIRMLDFYEIPIAGARAVVVGRSNIVGKPLAFLLLQRHATVTICHSRTRDLPSLTREANILVAAIGQTAMLTGHFVGEDATVIDVGTNRVSSAADVERIFPDDQHVKRLDDIGRRGYTLVGDVEPRTVIPRAAALTPVPGGVGPLTIAGLMENTVRAAIERRGLRGSQS